MKIKNRLDNDLKLYYTKIKENAVCGKKEKSKLISDTENAVKEYLAINENPTIEDIYNNIGTPEEITDSLNFTSDKGYIKRKLSIKRAVVIALIAIVAIVLAYFVSTLISDIKYDKGYYVEEGPYEISELPSDNTLAYVE